MKHPRAEAQHAFAQFLAGHRETLRGQLTRLVPPSEVDDVLQEVFVKVARALPEFRGEAAVRTWLHQIAQRTAYDHLRSRRHRERQRTVSLTDEMNAAGCGSGGRCASSALVPAEAPRQLVEAEMRGCIREFIRRLPSNHAEMLTLKDIDGLTNGEIAARLGITLDAAKIRLHRARTAMRALLDHGCELYRTTENTLACDRKPRRHVT